MFCLAIHNQPFRKYLTRNQSFLCAEIFQPRGWKNLQIP